MTYQPMLDASLALKSPEGCLGVGFFFYLLVGGETTINGPIACSSKRITCLVALVVKAELAAPFQFVQLIVQHRKILKDFGYPQQDKLIRIDFDCFLQRASLAAPLLFVGSL